MKKQMIAATATCLILTSFWSVNTYAEDPQTPQNGVEETKTAENETGETISDEIISDKTISDETKADEIDSWHWQEDGSEWKYINNDDTYKRNCWEKIGDYWYHFDRDGYMATGWTKVNGYQYLFRDTGDLAIGWCYNDEREKWYYFTPEGELTKGWFLDDDGSWYYFTTRGEMSASGDKIVDGLKYHFLENGQMAANQYVGLNYMDKNGQRDKKHDIVIQGKKKESSLTSEEKEEITKALQNIPRNWIDYFISHGWEIVYYPDKQYFSAPTSGNGQYYVYHKLDTSYRKIKFCKAEDLTAAFGEYIGYAADCYNSDKEDAQDLFMYRGYINDYLYIPDYYDDDMQFVFGELVEYYVNDPDIKEQLRESAPMVCEILDRVLYILPYGEIATENEQ